MATQNQDRLRTHFSSAPDSAHSNRWDDLWKEGTFLPWDRGSANPALIDVLASRDRPQTSPDPNPTAGAPPPNSVSQGYASLPAPRNSTSERRARVLIPGCGKGYDIALFAAYGYDAYGLEVSEHAVQAARKYLEDPGKGPLEGEYNVQNEELGKGSMNVLLGDFFDNAWLKEVKGWEGDEGFDIIYDNTFLCALPPSLRPKWAKRTTDLLRSHKNDQSSSDDHTHDGMLICLEFPTHKPASSGGPPWSLPPTVHAELLKRPGEDIEYDEKNVVKTSEREEADNALVKVAHYTPKRTHNVGVIQGIVRDCVSMWRHKSDVSQRERWH